jgi:HD-GYP domain-containing protein (c-di-GMP phosphodiesterase class II)
MFVHKLEGSWLDHSFWRSQFLIKSQSEIDEILESEIDSVLIDVSRGLTPDVASEQSGKKPDPSAACVEPALEPNGPALKVKRKSGGRLKPCTAPEELARAAKIVDSSRAAVQRLFADVRLGNAMSLPEVLSVVDEISNSVARNASALISVTRLRSKDEYTYMHSVAVCALMINLGRELGLEEAMMRDLGMAGLLHDVGKLEVPPEVLNKPGQLTDAEFRVMKTHAERGHEVLAANGNVSDLALEVCLHHHEKVDGTGYPNRLSGAEISLFAKMGAVCDVYDAMTSNRCYKQAWTPSESLSKMFQWSGHFDDEILQAFIRSVGIYPVGSLVRLKSAHLGVVIDHDAEHLTKPRVRIFCSTSNPRSTVLRDVNLTESYDHIVSREDPRSWGFMNFDAEWPLLLTKGVAPRVLSLAS